MPLRLFLFSVGLLCVVVTHAQSRLWYKQPALSWEEALPIGNGKLGAMIFGGDQEEEVQFNEETLWTGEPRAYSRAGAHQYLAPIRSLLDEGKQAEAEALAMEQFMGLKSLSEDNKAWLHQIEKERVNPKGPISYDFDDGGWKSIPVPSYEGWEEVGLEGVDGAVWFRNSFELTAQDIQEDWILDLNKIREQDFTYINGKWVGHTEGDQAKRLYKVPKEILQVGRNVIAIQVINLTGKGGIAGYKDPKETIALRNVKRGFISLAGLWKYWIQDADVPKVGTYQASYQPFGSLRFSFPDGKTEDYQRSLDLDRGLVEVHYKQGDVSFSRSYFASYPDNLIGIRLTADKPKQVYFSVTLASKHANKRLWQIDKHSLALQVKVKGGVLEATSFVTLKLKGGKLYEQDGILHVEAADCVDVLLTGATNYSDYLHVQPAYFDSAEKHHQEVCRQSFDRLFTRHQKDYQRLYSQFAIQMGDQENDVLPTDERLQRFTSLADPGLIALYVQYGRYLQIASSRKGTQPSNLQGIWNHLLEPSWGSKYTTNINLEMNYWPTEMFNLSELHTPLFQMIRELSKAGEETAKAYYNARGWVLHHNTDIWRGTSPINNSNHGIWPTGGAWLVTHLWEHYRYNQDPQFIKEYYDVIKGATLFFKDVLVKDTQTGWYVSTPSNSPEHGGLVKGPTMDHQIIRALFSVFVASSQLVGSDKELQDSIAAMIPQIAPNQIGKYGQLQEWLEDKDDPDNKHRHVSHLWGLHPGNEINLDKTPGLLQAAKQSLLMRGDDGTGWSLAWKINFWARLQDAEHTYAMIKMLLRPAGKSGGSYPNLFDAHPPFQIDGNFGGAAGIGELLLQSQGDYIDLLPALPRELPDGNVKGFRARGGFTVDFQWKDHELTSVCVHSLVGNHLALRYKGKTVQIPTKKNKLYRFDPELNLHN
ncbi:glycosyl hydrolase family 95 catalytic domain-containing protein [Sphingobacterium sp. LRF_L2]|uniref:glycoside hydrolase family 95 protein n=1 Tax=Sphingobacterium sp. LRF_L2 TaxID=3369421 RepID=UPI003F642D30